METKPCGTYIPSHPRFKVTTEANYFLFCLSLRRSTFPSLSILCLQLMIVADIVGKYQRRISNVVFIHSMLLLISCAIVLSSQRVSID